MMARISVFALLVVLASVAIQAQGKGNPVFDDFEKTAPLAGQAAPRLHLKDTEGKEMDLRDHLGAWVVIEFGSYT